MHKLTFSLKQHTPIIHFQHDQDGATLRATEVKPKLDKYIIEQYGGIDAVRRANPDWFSSKEHDALDYKLTISANVDKTYFIFSNETNQYKLNQLKNDYPESDFIPVSPYFAENERLKKNPSDGVFEINEEGIKKGIYCANIHCKIIDKSKTLNEALGNKIEDFFAINNFGTRQSKGFGSFTVIEKNEQKASGNINSFYLYKSANQYNNYDKIFDFIQSEYQLLKSGKNYQGYEKSKLFEYFAERDIRWEKRYFKKFITANKILDKELLSKGHQALDFDRAAGHLIYKESNKDTSEYQYKYIRALLGTADRLEFAVQDDSKKYIVTYKHNPENGKDVIDRFKSPITFKVIDGYVYILINDTYKTILDQSYEFKLSLKGERENTVKNMGSLRTPSSFDLAEFLSKYLSKKWTK